MDKLRQKREKECAEQYKKKLTIVSKKKRTGLIIAGCVLLAGAGGTGGYFAYKAATRLPDVVVDGYVVKFNGTSLTDLKVKKGATINLKEINPGEKKGYLFDWWYYDEKLTQKCPNTIVINKDITIYAKWNLVVSEDGLGFLLNADGNSYTLVCLDKDELYKNIENHGYELTIPDSHKEGDIKRPVTCVGYYNAELDISYGFEDCTKIKTINFQNNANEIAPRAFKGCTGLISVSLKNSNITSIGSEAFANCTANKSLTTYSDTTNANSPLVEIGENAFSNNLSLETINLTNSLLRISNSAFKNCTSLATVNFHENSIIQNIGESCFEGCTSLENCNVPYSVCKFNQNSFKGCPLNNMTYDDGISTWSKEDGSEVKKEDIASLLNKGNLIFKNAIKSDTYKLSFYIIGIVNDKEYNLSAADSTDRESTDVEIPDNFKIKEDTITLNVTRVAEQGFKDSNITSVTIPYSVVTIGADAFNNCRSLSTINFTKDKENKEYLIGIGDNAFKSSAITAITLPATLKSIGTNAFCYTNLSTIDIPKSVAELKYSKLQVTDPTTQEKYNATLAPFYGCHYMKSINVEDGNAYYKSDNGVLFEKNKDESFTLMRFPEIKSVTDNTYTIPDKTSIIASGSFYGNKNAKIIKMSKDVLMINDGAFASSDRENVITDIKFASDSELIHIGKYAFDGAKITTINIGDFKNLETIDDYAFYKCSNLNKIEIPSGVNYLGLNILANCSKIYSPTQVVFKDETHSWNIYKHNTEETYEENFVPVESGATKQDALSYLRGSNNRIAYWKKN